MNFDGILVGILAFAAIGIFHPLVIKAEYYFTAKSWWVFLLGGIIFCLLSVLADNIIISAGLAVFGFSSLWSIGELKKQEERVKKGWFPKNEKRKK